MCMETIKENFYFELSSLQLYDCNFSEGLKCNGLKLSYRDSVLSHLHPFASLNQLSW